MTSDELLTGHIKQTTIGVQTRQHRSNPIKYGGNDKFVVKTNHLSLQNTLPHSIEI